MDHETMRKYQGEAVYAAQMGRGPLGGVVAGDRIGSFTTPAAELERIPGPGDQLGRATAFLREAAGAVANLKDRLCGESKEPHGDGAMIASGYLGNISAEAAVVDALARSIMAHVNEINSRL